MVSTDNALTINRGRAIDGPRLIVDHSHNLHITYADTLPIVPLMRPADSDHQRLLIGGVQLRLLLLETIDLRFAA